MSRAAPLLAALLAAALLADPFQLRFLAEILIVGTAVMALDLLVGFGGLVSLGHAALFGGAAYAVAIAAIALDGAWGGAWGGELALLLPLGIATGAGLAALMALATIRTGQLALLVLTLLLGQVVFELALHGRAVTGGADGLRGLPAPSLGPVALGGARPLFLLATALAAAAYAVARSFAAAPVGRALVGTREQAPRMRALGYGVFSIRLRAMVLSGALAGAAGALYPFVNLYVGPHSVHWTLSAAMVVMLVIGGTGTLWGAFLGTALFLAMQTYLGAYTDRWQLGVGLVFVLTVLLLPGGLAGLLVRMAQPQKARPRIPRS